MKIIKSPVEMKNLSHTLLRGGKTIGLVPTMGALHAGHLSLLDIIRKQTDYSVMSIFVNPTQFGPQEDFQRYPRPFEDDCALAQKAGCDIIFAPSKEDMYPQHYYTYISVENITTRLCGLSRPNHFRGVTTVVAKLFNIVSPQVAVFGQKDAQQVVVIKRMVRDLDMAVKIEVAPIIRESDGLAMSSRNRYLTAAERVKVPLIYSGLKKAKELYDAGERNARALVESVKSIYVKTDIFSPEYIELVNTITLTPVERLSEPALLAVACRTQESGTRLIDNIVLGGTL